MTLHAPTALTHCCMWLGLLCVQTELGKYVTVNEPKINEKGEEIEDLIVARVVEMVYTVSGKRLIGVNWMYRITVSACLRAGSFKVGIIVCAWRCWQWWFLLCYHARVHLCMHRSLTPNPVCIDHTC